MIEPAPAGRAGSIAMIDPWKKAEECERALATCTDKERRRVLTNLHELWIAVGNEKAAGTSTWQSNAEYAAKVHARHPLAIRTSPTRQATARATTATPRDDGRSLRG
jgi:hypothetical protein